MAVVKRAILSVSDKRGLVEFAGGLAETGVALLVISHDVSVIARTCDRAAVMRNGEIIEHGPAPRILSAPEHPYTRRLIEAVPRLPGPAERS